MGDPTVTGNMKHACARGLHRNPNSVSWLAY